MLNNELKGAFLVAEALTGNDYKAVSVAGHIYIIQSPTIARLAGCIKCLSAMQTGDSVADVLRTIGDLNAYARALSWLIQGDEGLSEDLSKGTPEECVTAVERGLSLIDVSVFQKAVTLQRFVARLAATNTR